MGNVVLGVSVGFEGGIADDCGAGGVEAVGCAEDMVWKYFGVDEDIMGFSYQERGEGWCCVSKGFSRLWDCCLHTTIYR